MTDVLIVGGGVAGSSLAMLLGRQGLRVELYEKAVFPREKPCGEGLMPAGVAVLDRLGLRQAAGGAPFLGVRYHFGGRTAEGRFPSAPGSPRAGLGIRRLHLDALLFEAARRSIGVRAFSGVSVDAPIVSNGSVIGVRVGGEERRARLVVAADGVHSRTRHALGLHIPARRKRFGLCAHFRLAPGMAQPPWVDVFVCREYELYVTPLPENELLVASLANAQAFREPVDRAFHRWRSTPRALSERLEGAVQISDVAAASPLSGQARRGFVPGCVLLGDAAGFLDPITGGGMTQALMSAELLASHLTQGVPADSAWMARFDRERRRMLRDYRMLTRAVLWLGDHARVAELLLAALGNSPALFSHLIGVSGGTRRLLPFPGVS